MVGVRVPLVLAHPHEVDERTAWDESASYPLTGRRRSRGTGGPGRDTASRLVTEEGPYGSSPTRSLREPGAAGRRGSLGGMGIDGPAAGRPYRVAW